MSNVWNYMLILPIHDDDTNEPLDGDLPTGLQAFNAALSAGTFNPQGFTRVDHRAGGYKAFEASVFLLATPRDPGALCPLLATHLKISDGWEPQFGLVVKGPEDEPLVMLSWEKVKGPWNGS